MGDLLPLRACSIIPHIHLAAAVAVVLAARQTCIAGFEWLQRILRGNSICIAKSGTLLGQRAKGEKSASWGVRGRDEPGPWRVGSQSSLARIKLRHGAPILKTAYHFVRLGLMSMRELRTAGYVRGAAVFRCGCNRWVEKQAECCRFASAGRDH